MFGAERILWKLLLFKDKVHRYIINWLKEYSIIGEMPLSSKY